MAGWVSGNQTGSTQHNYLVKIPVAIAWGWRIWKWERTGTKGSTFWLFAILQRGTSETILQGLIKGNYKFRHNTKPLTHAHSGNQDLWFLEKQPPTLYTGTVWNSYWVLQPLPLGKSTKSYDAMYLSSTKISGKYYPSANKECKANSNHNWKFNFSLTYIWSWLSYTTAQIMIVIATAKVTFHQIRLTASKGRRWITKINFLLITEGVRITTDRYNCHSAFRNLYKNFSIVRGGLSHIRQRVNAKQENNSSNVSKHKKNPTVKQTIKNPTNTHRHTPPNKVSWKEMWKYRQKTIGGWYRNSQSVSQHHPHLFIQIT